MRARDLVTRNLISPYGLAVASLLLFLVAWFMPPSVYMAYLGEPDYIFLDPASLLFFLLCVMGFLAGVKLIDFNFPLTGAHAEGRKTSFSPALFLLVPLGFGMGFAIVSCLKLIHDNPNLLPALLAAQAADLKEDNSIQTGGLLAQAAPLLMGILWWAMWRKRELPLSKRGRVWVNAAIFLAGMLLVLCSILLVTRSELMVALAGILIVDLLIRQKEGRLTTFFAIKTLCLGAGAVVMLFLAFSLLRGATDSSFLVSSFLGYTISSYNRLAAMLAGVLRYPFGGTGVYISAFAAFSNSFNAVFHLNRHLQWPSFDSVWRSEFDAVSAAGLDGRLIWSGAFGYAFADLGWFAPVLLLVYGAFTGAAWRSLRARNLAGIILYPWCGYCILFWFGTNYLLDSKLADLFIVIAVLYAYEAALYKRQAAA